ncbi:MAG: hypothetical protein Tsb0020_36240 [Haliangiales bacterium]
MTWTVSHHVEASLRAAAESVLPAGLCRGATLRQAILDRSRRLTRERGDEREPIAALTHREANADLAAHALFFAPADAAKVMIPLAELNSRGLLGAGTRADAPLRVLDVGAGPGAMTLGALDFLRTVGFAKPLQLRAVDRDRDALRVYKQAAREMARRCEISHQPVEIEVEAADLASRREYGPADLIVMGSVLNELSQLRARELVAELLQALTPQGALIIIEPALRDTTRALHVIRDEIIASAQAHVFAPCVRRLAPCPALADERDWCHEDRPVQLSERTAQLAVNTGLRVHGLKFSYLVLRHGDDTLNAGSQQVARIVSHPRRSKGKRSCFACSDGGRVEVRLLKRNRSESNRGFERVRRGDIVEWDQPRPLDGDISADAHVSVLRPGELD